MSRSSVWTIDTGWHFTNHNQERLDAFLPHWDHQDIDECCRLSLDLFASVFRWHSRKLEILLVDLSCRKPWEREKKNIQCVHKTLFYVFFSFEVVWCSICRDSALYSNDHNAKLPPQSTQIIHSKYTAKNGIQKCQ